MIATGIVRKIDELGRIVIPKEIRKTMKIREGEPLEIFVEKTGEVILKKYDPLSDLKNEVDIFTETLEKNTGLVAIITDMKGIIAVSSKGKKDYSNKALSSECINAINKRTLWSTKDKSVISIKEDDNKQEIYSEAISPIIADSDLIGAVILISFEAKKVISVGDIKLLEIASEILSKLME